MPVETAPKARKLPEARFAPAEVMRVRYVIVPEEGTSFEELLEPIYWSHVARRLRALDILEIHPEDGSYFAELLVRGVGPKGAQVVTLRMKKLGEVEDLGEAFKIQWKGGHLKHAVIRSRDKEVLQGGFANKEDAAAWLASNLASLAA